jgi:multidrug resistance efflux pump
MKSIYILILSIILLISCSKNEKSITPEIKNITESVYSSGFVKSKNQYEVFSKTAGVLKKIFIKEGDFVKVGDTLFQLENENSKLNTENARLLANNANYQNNKAKVEDLENNINVAIQKFKSDSLLLERQKNLWANKIGSKFELEQKELNYDNSKNNIESLKIKLIDLKKQLKLNSQQSKNNLKIAKLMEEDFIIKSEVEGVIYKINKEKGELITNMSAIASIGAEDFIIEINIDEIDIVKIELGQEVFIRMDSYQDKVFEATVSDIQPIMNERTRTFKIEAKFTIKPEKLYPNLTVEANIVINNKNKVLTIPRNYLTNNSEVKLENGDLVKVETGLMDYNIVEILSGIDSNTKLVLP